LSPDAICHGYLFSSPDPQDEHINEQVHWSVIEKHRNPAAYNPPNLPERIPDDRITAITREEQAMLPGE
jgi:hypothetical protein